MTMRHTPILVLVLLLGSAFQLPARAQDAVQKRLAEAAAAYAQADYGRAADRYEALAREGHTNAALLYNLGNAYLKNGKNTRAILCYERALRLDPSDAQTSDNLAIAYARARDRVEPMPLFFAARWWNDLKSGNTPRALFWYSFCLLCLTGLWVFLFFGMRNVLLRRVALAAGTVSALLFAASVFVYLDRVEDLEARRDAVVIAPEVVARSTPDKSGVDAFSIHEGLKVEIVEERGEWLRIRLADGTEGWLTPAAIERI
jgi:tetratricopeptide (TPR) repeat protein